MGKMKNDPDRTDPNLQAGDGLSRERVLTFVLIAATAIAFYLCYKIALPFIPSITWALALAVAAYPLHKWIGSRLKSPSLAAGLAVLAVALVIVAPGLFLAQNLVSQIGKGAEAIRTQTESGQWRRTVESNPKLAAIVNRVEPHFDVRSAAERAADAAASHISAFIGGFIWVMAQTLITFFTLFYLFRDRQTIVKNVRSLIPLSRSETDRMFAGIGNTIYATLYGTFSVSLVQGVLGGLMFWWLGLPAPLLWGSVMFLLSLIPVLGAPVVWIPAAIYLALTGDWGKALIMAGWGVIVVGSADNLLYPVLVGDKLRMHPLLVFFSVIGGLSLIGAAGLVLGPLTVVITSMLIDIWRRRTSGGRAVEDGFRE